MAEKSIRITEEAHKLLVNHSEKEPVKMGKFASVAIKEKIERDNTKENPVLERQNKTT